jgi:hypothetical protein
MATISLFRLAGSTFLRGSLIAACLAPSDLAAQAFTVEAVGAADGRPVGPVSVTLIGENGKTARQAIASDSLGRATIVAPEAGRYRVLVRRFGFKADTSPLLRVGAGELIARKVELTQIPYELPKVNVVDEVKTAANLERREFEFRKRTVQVGGVYTKRNLDSMRVANLAEAVNLTPGARVTFGRDMNMKWTGPFCGNAAVFWNGLRLNDAQALSFILDIDLKWVTGLEVYSTPGSVPMDYNARGVCAVVAVWTKQSMIRK